MAGSAIAKAVVTEALVSRIQALVGEELLLLVATLLVLLFLAQSDAA
jgi:hypothetical protein